MAAEPNENQTMIDKRYYAAGATWENDIHRSLRRSRSAAWIVTAFMGIVTLLSLTGLVMLLPLKQFEPYMVMVDKTTGYLEVARALQPGNMSQNEAVTAANLVRFIRARETYDPREIKLNYELAQLYSSDKASEELVRAFSPSNPNALNKIYGRDSTVAVTIKSVSLLARNTAQVRFSTETKRNNSTPIIAHWVGILQFRYTTTPLKNEWRFDNPLGFQVISYRRDQESAPTAGAATQ